MKLVSGPLSAHTWPQPSTSLLQCAVLYSPSAITLIILLQHNSAMLVLLPHRFIPWPLIILLITWFVLDCLLPMVQWSSDQHTDLSKCEPPVSRWAIAPIVSTELWWHCPRCDNSINCDPSTFLQQPTHHPTLRNSGHLLSDQFFLRLELGGCCTVVQKCQNPQL